MRKLHVRFVLSVVGTAGRFTSRDAAAHRATHDVRNGLVDSVRGTVLAWGAILKEVTSHPGVCHHGNNSNCDDLNVAFRTSEYVSVEIR